MSFILDALKKSESDRQRQSGPSLFEVKVAPPRRALPVWAVAIAVLLGINVIVIYWMLLRRRRSRTGAWRAGGSRGWHAAASPGRELGSTPRVGSSCQPRRSERRPAAPRRQSER
jgi:general secretion pathway protein B